MNRRHASVMGTVLALTGFWTASAAALPRPDYDLDNDGLIEINDLYDLDEVRNNPFGQQLYGLSTGCPSPGGCHGFELAADLDFDENGDGVVDGDDAHIFETDDGYLGWIPIQTLATTFEGNNRVIRNLTYRARSELSGLFLDLVGATVRNLRFAEVDFLDVGHGTGILAANLTTSSSLQNVSVESGSLYVNGESSIGGLVGNCVGSSIQESRTSMDLRASGWVGGLIGTSDNCTIARSFVRGRTASSRYHGFIGGLVGYMIAGSISDSFVSGNVGDGYWFGGLIGQTEGSVTITNTFVSGAVIGTGYGGGALVGVGPATIVSSFYATDTTGYSKTSGTGATAVTLADLKCTDTASDPDCKAGLFAGWQSRLNSDGQAAWDFGTNQQVPALRIKGVVYRDNDGDGLLNAEDQFPNNWEASRDTDNDGAIDFWREGCGEACRAASTLVLDQFPNNAAATLDLDLDGLPDAWNASCNSTCQTASGLTLDTRLADVDNDGLGDLADQDDDADGSPDVDLDSDNLIDISNWTQLNQMRNDPGGASLRTTEDFQEFGIPLDDTSGCRPRIVQGTLRRECDGYELLADLNFDTNGNNSIGPGDAFWNDGGGWVAVGHHGDVQYQAFRTNFEGNGHVISNLWANNPLSESGLFGGVRGANIRNVGLTGPLMSITGNSRVGALIGDLVMSTVTNCYATGPVSSDGGSNTGGLIGEASGGAIVGVFASGDVLAFGNGNTDTGGLIGGMGWSATLTASFASGSVTNQTTLSTGGLVGSVREGVVISGSYSIGAVTGPTPDVGGLIGKSLQNVVSSYWATDTSTRTTSAGGAQPATVSQMNCPTSPNNTSCRPGTTLFSGWAQYASKSGAPYWEQGSATQLPGLCVNGSLFRPNNAGDLLAPTACACLDADQQLVSNQGFESNTNGWVGSAGTSISSATGAAHSGSRSLRITNRNTGTWQGAEYNLLGLAAPGETLATSLWARVSGDPSEPVLFTLRSTCQGGATVYTNVASSTATDTGWVQLKGNVPVPNCTLTQLVGYAEGPRTGVVLLIDDVSITRKNLVCQGTQGPLTGSFIVTTNWGSGYCVELRVTNPAMTPTTNWSAAFNLNGTTIYDKWNINTSASSGSITVTPFAGWRVIAPGASTNSLGFCANRPAGNTTALPTGLVVTGTF